VWVIDGAATISISNGQGCVKGSLRSKQTILEVVGQTRIICDQVCDHVLDCYTPKGTTKQITLKNIPVLKKIRYNLLSEKDCTEQGLAIVKEGEKCWLLDTNSEIHAVASLSPTLGLYFVAMDQKVADEVSECPFQRNQERHGKQ
jgi:hypothetical protein